MQGRKDQKGRLLHNGEYQEPSGRYFFQYFDIDGKRKRVTAWRLNPSDRTPPGRRQDKCLREKEAEIKKDIDSGVVANNQMTVEQLCKSYLERYSSSMAIATVEGHESAIKNLRKSGLYRLKIRSITVAKAKDLIQELVSKHGMTYSQVRKIKSLLTKACQMAYEDDALAKNPFLFNLKCINGLPKLQQRIGLEPDEKDSLLEFVKNSKIYCKHYDKLVILLGTGLRIAEFCGLTIDNIDFEKNLIYVEKQVRKFNSKFEVWSPKSAAGVRYIPMTEEVRAAFERVLSKRKPLKEPTIGNTSGFVFINSCGRVADPKSVWDNLNNVKNAYNTETGKELKLSPHILRHTFCSDCVRNGMDSKVLQLIMGHENYSTTFNIYTHISVSDIQAEFKSKMT